LMKRRKAVKINDIVAVVLIVLFISGYLLLLNYFRWSGKAVQLFFVNAFPFFKQNNLQ
jgi:hypothetical protein